MDKTVILLSGGLDSTTLLYWLKARDHELHPLSVIYGQKHARELWYADRTCEKLSLEHHIANLTQASFLFEGSALTSDDIEVPEGHYEDESMKLTVVPNRNMVMLSLAIALAVSIKADNVAYAPHAGDHAIYPDCREEFVAAMALAASLCDWHPITLLRPFVEKSKAEIVTEGTFLEVPFLDTWSCYKGSDYHCGKCGTCVERIEAFKDAGVPDPTRYADFA